ncbi:MAG: sugar ABC transporter permease [Candidatus Caldatribacterium sp.]|uniref:carbohydrate ABC transporter permease n=1 Tax=Candidatus Caldatribacterium sp. TaxID=2282143 RepID=UPI00299A289F|nr:sugar ABC transporter permease [Candidatus Caldatribacterium sp.]MCX7729772.1 sugar ABC transporter permease [Candidatus Caldatribacterium sp.]MDW8081904.1 sugar ABC transporter permease [Candidatus Calescibacterium sp.]
MTSEKTLLGKIGTYVLFAGPTTFAFFTVVLLPFLFGVYLTLTNWDGLSAHYVFVGFKNYRAVLQDKAFWTSFSLTLKYVLYTVILTNILAFTLAYLLTSGMKGQNLLRAGFFVPNLIGGIVLGLIWRFVFSDVLVYLGKRFGWELFTRSWLAHPDKAFWALVIVSVWQSSGYMMVIYIAGLMGIPKDLIEAATIEGASGLQRLRYVILPLLTPFITVCVFLSLQRGFIVYDLNKALTEGGPYKSTELVAMHVYEKAFLAQQYEVGQTEAFFLFAMIVGATLAQVYLGKRLEVEQ